MSNELSLEAQWEEFVKKNGYVTRDHSEVLGARLKDFRVKQKMSVEQTAAKSGFSKGTISNYENGKTSPTIDDLLVLLLTYESTLHEYLGIEEANYKDDCEVFKRYGLSETFCRALSFAKE